MGSFETLLKGVAPAIGKTDDQLAALLAHPDPLGLGEDVRYDHSKKEWLYWEGVRWHPDKTKNINNLIREQAVKYANAVEPDAQGIDQHILDADAIKAIRTLLDMPKKSKVKDSLSGWKGIAMDGSEWDKDGYLVGFDDGIVNLRTGKFLDNPPRDRDYVSKTTGTTYAAVQTAKAPVFEAFLVNIMGGDMEMVAYIKRLIGYSLIGDQIEQKFWLWTGKGSNGKGILARSIDHAFGDYAVKPADTLYMRTRQGPENSSRPRPDLLALRDARFIYMSEPPGGQFHEELLKAHTGNDTITARNLFSGIELEFPPTFTAVILCNEMPKTDDVGVSMQRRVRRIDFEQNYEARPDFIMPDGEVIPSMQLEDRIRQEQDGILWIAIKEALLYLKDGLPEPEKVVNWSKEYIEENNPLHDFYQDRCLIGPGEKGSASALWNAYEEWADDNRETRLGKRAFYAALEKAYVKPPRVGVGQFYKGIRPLNAMELAERGGDG